MSALKEYKEMEAERQEVAKKSAEHYLKVDLPGKRNMDADAAAAKARIAEMKKQRELPNHEVK